MSSNILRACDNCHGRKIKCDGTMPCSSCEKAGFNCTYDAIPGEKGPQKGESLRGNKMHSKIRDARCINFRSSWILLPNLGGARYDLPTKLVNSCLDFFFDHLYPCTPVLRRRQAQEVAMNMERSTEAYCLIVALCAYVMIQANMKVALNLLPSSKLAQMSNINLGRALLEESVRVRNDYDHRKEPTHLTVLISWFFNGSYLGLAQEDTAWLYLQEAITYAHALGMHEEATYKLDPLDISRKKVLYWFLFISERTSALHSHHQISLYPTINPPSLDQLLSDQSIAVGLQILIGLFKIVDDGFINLYTNANPDWFSQVQTQLSKAVPAYLECTKAQAVEIRVTQQWLKTIVWQLYIYQEPWSNDNCMNLEYPIQISRDLLEIMKQYTQQAMEVHGAKLLEKLFDVLSCLADVLTNPSFSSDAFTTDPRDYVAQLLLLICTLPGGKTRYLPLLSIELSELVPDLLRSASTFDVSGTNSLQYI